MAERAQSITSQSRSSLGALSLSPVWKRWLNFEFWPFYLLYIPAYFYWFFLALKARHPTYFTAVNPLMNNSGALESSKHHYLKKLPHAWIPTTVRIPEKTPADVGLRLFEQSNIHFPLVLKPDCGERGKGVYVVASKNEFVEKINRLSGNAALMQSYCDYPNEAGIMFYRFPKAQKCHISSITTKAFCTLRGNGRDTLGELISQNERIYHRRKMLKTKFDDQWNRVLEEGESFFVEPVGSHNLGTKFMDSCHLNTPRLEDLITHWANQLPGLYYGRFDIKFKNWESLLEGKDFKIIEINGVNAEPTHIYDPKYKLVKAYQDIFFHMDIIYEISKQNRALGYRPKPLFPFLTELIKTATQTAV